MSLFTTIAENAKAIGAVVTCCTGVAGGAAYFEMVPATRSYVMAETLSVKRDLIDSRLETNDVRRQLLRKEKFDRTLELEKEQQPNVRLILRERLEWIEGELDTIGKAREELRKERAVK